MNRCLAMKKSCRLIRDRQIKQFYTKKRLGDCRLELHNIGHPMGGVHDDEHHERYWVVFRPMGGVMVV